MSQDEIKKTRNGEDRADWDIDDWRQVTPGERVRAVAELTLRELGLAEFPPFKRVCRVVDAPWVKD